MNDELKDQLRRLDPMHSGVPVESLTTPSSRARLENIMNTPIETSNSAAARPTPAVASRRKWSLIGAVAAAAVLAVGTAAILANSGDDGSQAATPPLELSLGDSNAISSCMAFDVALLAEMAPAFAGTASAVDGDSVTLTVDRWYAGGDAESVVLRGTGASPALIAGFEFEVGKQYLITAAEGNVNFCGYSGVATPELTAAFEAAFAD